jgi:cytochrome c oxidase cbb3-type subunit 3
MKRMSIVVMIAACLGAAGCERERRRFSELAPASDRPQPPAASELQAGSPGAPASSPASRSMALIDGEGPYENNAWAVSEGKRLYTWFNCVGCHAHGGGGMGPPLMDAQWIYGGDPEQVHASIVGGRPNGMPAFGGKIPDQQVWQLVAYVRSMSGLIRKDVRSGRNDDMSVRSSEQFRKAEPRNDAGAPAAGAENTR